MKKIFIDNNIIIDFLAQTRPTHKEAIELFKNQKEDEIFCFSFGSISDIYYILNKEYDTDKKNIIDFFNGLSTSSKYECLSISDEYLRKSCEYVLNQISNNKKSDFEDTLQYFCALENGCSCIITNDKKFPKLDIPLIRTNPKFENYTPENKAENTQAQEKKGVIDNIINFVRKNK